SFVMPRRNPYSSGAAGSSAAFFVHCAGAIWAKQRNRSENKNARNMREIIRDRSTDYAESLWTSERIIPSSVAGSNGVETYSLHPAASACARNWSAPYAETARIGTESSDFR